MVTEYDHIVKRCPRLGHDVPFSYCRKPGDDTPCNGMYDCWWETVDINAFMANHYPPEVIAKVTTPRKPKTHSLLEIIQEARKRAQSR